jgi:rubrerythrin
MNPVSELTLDALGGDDALPFYGRALRLACEQEPPPYGMRWFGDEFRRLARDPGWFAGLLHSDAELEGYSARQLWLFADSVPTPAFAEQLRKHARDEARHSKLFARLLLRLFPQFDTEPGRRELAAFSPTLELAGSPPPADWRSTGDRRTTDELLNAVILINLHEVQALILERLLQPCLVAYAEPQDRQHVAKVADALIRDELEHIRYTARFLEAASSEHGDYIEVAMTDFQSVLNQLSREDVQHTRAIAG